MFKTKQQIDNHVRVIQAHLKSDKDRNLRGLNFSQLYYKIGEYELSRKYISNYMCVNDKSAPAYKQLGLCLDALGQKEKAYSAYKTSLDIEPKQPDLLIKVCEILLHGDVVLDPDRTKYWCELAETQFPSNNTVFRLKEKMMEALDSSPMEIKELILKELSISPNDPFLRIRYLQHLLQQNLIIDAFQHSQEIEFKNLSIFKDNVKWYDTLTDILQKYKLDVDEKKHSSWDYWLFNLTVLEKQICLSLSEMHSYRKSLVDCANSIFSLDQALQEASKTVKSLCRERELSTQFLLHFQGQLCLHIATFLFKRAKKDHNIWKETIKHCSPLLLLAFHTSPPDLQDNWLNHTTESNRQIVQKWNREGSYRCSQAGHTLLSCITEKRSIFIDRVSNYCSGPWREKLYKTVFSKLDHISKMNTSYFVNSITFKEPTLTLPGLSELKLYDKVAQRQYPNSLHHLVWLGLINKNLWDLKCNIFEGLQFSMNNLANCNAECLNQLDMDTFVYCSVICTQALREESVNSGYVSSDKPSLLPANIMEQLCSSLQQKWWSAAYKLYKNDTQSELGELRLTITRGIEIVRCVGQHGLDAKLLCILASTFNERAKLCEIKSEKHFLEARVSLFYTAAYPLLHRLKTHQTICPIANRMFEFNQKEMKISEVLQLIEDLKMFQGVQLMNDNDYEKALETFHSVKNPYASFHQGVIYKKLASDQLSSSKENLTSEMRSKHIIMLSKARDCFHLTLDRLRDSKIGKHPLDQILASHMEEVEEQLSRIDPDTGVNRNDCELLSEDNISSAGSLGEHIQLNLSSNYINNSYNHANLNSTPKHKSRAQNFRSSMAANYEVRRTESRPSPERLDAQIRQLSIRRDNDMASLMDTIQLLVDEIKDMKCTMSQESKHQKKLFDEQKKLTEEIKGEVTELKKTLGKTKSSATPNLDDQDFGYLLEEELQNQEYSLPNLYPNYQPRVTQNTNMGYPNHMYQNPMYPMYSPYASMGQAVPFMEGQQMQDYRNQMLNQQLIYNQSMLNKLNPQESVAMLQAMNSVYPQNRASDIGPVIPNKPSETILTQQTLQTQQPAPAAPQTNQNLIGPALVASQPNTNLLSQLSLGTTKTQTTKSAPVNVVITNSDPLPSHTISTVQPTLSVTIPPHHIKTSTPQPMLPKGIHNYQIAMPNVQPSSLGQSVFGIPGVDVKLNKLPQESKTSVFGSPSISDNKFSTPKSQGALNLTSETKFSEVVTPKSSSKVSDEFQTPNNISVQSSSSIYITPNSNNMNQTALNLFVNSPSTATSTRLNRSSDSQCSNTSISERYDPLPDYKPIIPLPDVVEVKTGEEDEEIIFKSRAKLYRFVNKEWKERGVGELKLLKNKTTEKVRVLMRRDHTHKVCANHIITSTMTLTLMKDQTKAYIWYAPDFADENVIHEKLCARFKTEDLAKSFYDAFEKSRTAPAAQVENLSSENKTGTIAVSTNITHIGFGDKFKFKDGSWNCSSCYTMNVSKETSCVACQTPKVSVSVGSASGDGKVELNVGGFTFSSTPTFTLKEANNKKDSEVKPASTQKASPFTGFSFTKMSSDTSSIQTVNPFTPIKQKEQSKTPSKINEPEKLAALRMPNIIEPRLLLNTKTENIVNTTVNTSTEDVEEFVPTAEFAPVIPLPEVVQEQTGEENESVLFEERAKLLRFDPDAKEWKERGLGNMKILADKTNDQKVRLLMRREIILKVCCNHLITKDLQFSRMRNEKIHSVTWSAKDFSENEVKTEVFAIRFKTKELCDKFHDTVTRIQSKLKDPEAIKDSHLIDKSAASDVDNNPSTQLGFGDKFKPKSGSWSCEVCYVHNDSKNDYCVSCDSPKDDTIPKKDKNIFGSGSTQAFTFGMPSSMTQVNKPIETDNKHVTGTSSTSKATSQMGFGDKFKPKSGSWSCKACYISNASESDYCIACDSPKDDTIPKKDKNIFGSAPAQTFTFGIQGTPAQVQNVASSSTPTLAFGTKPVAATAGFTFGIPKSSAPSVTFGVNQPAFSFSPSKPADSGCGFSFGASGLASVPNTKNEIKEDTLTNSNSTTGNTFASSGSGKFEFVFAPKSPKTKSPQKDSTKTENDSDGEEEYASDDEGDNIYFTPVIPLPEKVVVTTGEESEEILYCHRAKLYRHTDNEWKERGLGDIKILLNPQTKKIRVLMRRDQVLKICLNHILTPDIEYLPKDERTWLFIANDFSEHEFALEKFCVRFKTEDIAKEFKKAIENAQASLSDNAPKVSRSSTQNDDSDIEITFETKVTDEERNLARKYMLPDNFYAYKYKEDCKGCIGCRSDEFQFLGEGTRNAKSTSSSLSTTFSFVKAQASLKTASNTPENIESKNSTEAGPVFGIKSINQSNAAKTQQPKNSDNQSSSPLIFGRTIFGQAPKAEVPKSDASKAQDTKPGGVLKPSLFSLVTSKPVSGSNIFSTGGIAPKPVETPDSSEKAELPKDHLKPAHKFGQNVFNVNLETSSKPLTSVVNIFSTPSVNQKSENIFGSNTGTPSVNQKFENVFGSNTGSAQKLFGSSPSVLSAKEPQKLLDSNSSLTSAQESSSTFGNVSTQSSFSFKSAIGAAAPLAQAEIKEDVPMFKTDSCLSFANIASDTKTQLNTFSQGASNSETPVPFSWAGAGAPVFGSKQTPKKGTLDTSESKANVSSNNADDENNDENGDVPDEEYDPHYDPIIAMPDAIVVTTGEEDETKIFCQRAKLFRYDSTTKEWKERGVGEIKLLHHPERNSYRLLLRREQVHKLVLNQLLDKGFVLKTMNSSDRAWCWAGINHAEQPGMGEELAVRFKNSELAKEFKTAVESAVLAISESNSSYIVQSYSDDDDSIPIEENIEYHDDYEDEDDERSIMIDKHATLMTRTSVGSFSELAAGDLQVLYDSDLFGARIMMFGADGSCVSNTVIAVNTTMNMYDTHCTWSAIDYALDEPRMRTLQAHFESVQDATEFHNTFKEGVSFAREADIVDPVPDVFAPEDD